MESESIKKLSEFLPRDTRLKILELLQNKENLSIEKDMPRILALALQSCPETKELVKKQVLQEIRNLCLSLNIIGEENKVQQFLNSLNNKDRTILLYIWKNRHANIRELSRTISAPTDTYTLTRIREVINPLSQSVLGKAILEFKESKIDPVTGNKKLFNWWLAEDIYPINKEEILDVFNEEQYLKIVTEVPDENVELSIDNDVLTISSDNYSKRIPLFYSVEKKKIKKTYKNNILEIRLKKR